MGPWKNYQLINGGLWGRADVRMRQRAGGRVCREARCGLCAQVDLRTSCLRMQGTTARWRALFLEAGSQSENTKSPGERDTAIYKIQR